jgi:hypothetical protein
MILFMTKVNYYFVEISKNIAFLIYTKITIMIDQSKTCSL